MKKWILIAVVAAIGVYLGYYLLKKTMFAAPVPQLTVPKTVGPKPPTKGKQSGSTTGMLGYV